MGISETQKKTKIQRKKMHEDETIIAEEIERLMELAVEEEYQELETEKADEMVLLMKCPPRVDKAWRQLSSSSSFSQELGLVAKYSESFNLLGPDLSPELRMEMASAELQNISKLYSVNKSKDFVGPVRIFSESNQGKLEVEGTVTHKLDMRPHDCIEEYGKLLRVRNMKPVAENRHIQVLDGCRGEHLTPTPALVVTEKLNKRREKRTRSDRSEVEAKVFQLFEREPRWTLRQLAQKTNQPEIFLKEILKELCVYSRSGRAYELKPEYKKCV
ncbi:hypothetical protein Rs2_01761 [Raphanus sativus]|uniref:Uncharacterized protein LOC108844540 n=1 Tax=Raphanus sativus TaxID=3726 RepID=A0A6J0MP78_RAPSA|nr:uncharacterized protein LOC108844540 [Raphanus sativus]KAJ4916211.1 hypothetical protein Rs2_01761 [Raphanus sativus]